MTMDTKALHKKLCTKFFYWWHNQPGANTEEGFEEWWTVQGEAIAALNRAEEAVAEPEAFLIERLEGTGYGPARKVLDARQYDPRDDDFWMPGAKERHRITPLCAIPPRPALALIEEMERAMEPFAKAAQDWSPEENAGFTFADDENLGMENEFTVGDFRRARTALASAKRFKEGA